MNTDLVDAVDPIDPEEERTPERAREEADSVERLLNGKPVASGEAPVRIAPLVARKERVITREEGLQQIGEILSNLSARPSGPANRLEFSVAGFKFTVTSPLVSLNENAIAFFINKDQFTFEPSFQSELDLKYQGETYHLIFAGGFFPFPNLSYALVSFLRMDPKEETA